MVPHWDLTPFLIQGVSFMDFIFLRLHGTVTSFVKVNNSNESIIRYEPLALSFNDSMNILYLKDGEKF